MISNNDAKEILAKEYHTDNYDYLSQRTKEALARKKSEGVTLGRPKGRTSSHYKLTGMEETIRVLREKGVSKSEIARIFKVHRNTVDSFIKRNNI